MGFDSDGRFRSLTLSKVGRYTSYIYINHGATDFQKKWRKILEWTGTFSLRIFGGQNMKISQSKRRFFWKIKYHVCGDEKNQKKSRFFAPWRGSNMTKLRWNLKKTAVFRGFFGSLRNKMQFWGSNLPVFWGVGGEKS